MLQNDGEGPPTSLLSRPREEIHTSKSCYHSTIEHFCRVEDENLQPMARDIGIFTWRSVVQNGDFL